MSSFSRFPTYHVSDDGTPYAPGEVVHVDHSSGQVQIIKDPDGDYEVINCRPATEYGGDPPPLRIGLRKRQAPPPGDLAALARRSDNRSAPRLPQHR